MALDIKNDYFKVRLRRAIAGEKLERLEEVSAETSATNRTAAVLTLSPF